MNNAPTQFGNCTVESRKYYGAEETHTRVAVICSKNSVWTATYAVPHAELSHTKIFEDWKADTNNGRRKHKNWDKI